MQVVGILEILLTEQGEVLEKIRVVGDFGIFVNRARRKKFLEKTRVEGDFGNFGNFAYAERITFSKGIRIQYF